MKFENVRELLANKIAGYRIRFMHSNGSLDITPELDEEIFIRSEEGAHKYARGMSRLRDENNFPQFYDISVVKVNVLEDEMVCGSTYNVYVPPVKPSEESVEPIPENIRLNFSELEPTKEPEPLELDEPLPEPSIDHPLVAPARDEPKKSRNIFRRG